MTAPDRMPEAFENSLHDAGHPHMEPPANPGRFSSAPSGFRSRPVMGSRLLSSSARSPFKVHHPDDLFLHATSSIRPSHPPPIAAAP